jgi:hypothetical protein
LCLLFTLNWGIFQVRLPCSLPSILIIDCCIRRESDLYFWNADGDHNDAVSNSTSARTKGVQSGLMSPANQTGSNWWLPFRIEITIDSLTSRVTVSEVGLACNTLCPH